VLEEALAIPRTMTRRFAMFKRTMVFAALTLLVLPLATAQAGLRIGIGLGTPPPYPYYICTLSLHPAVVPPPVETSAPVVEAAPTPVCARPVAIQPPTSPAPQAALPVH
jgi:hypothetical protein